MATDNALNIVFFMLMLKILIILKVHIWKQREKKISVKRTFVLQYAGGKSGEVYKIYIIYLNILGEYHRCFHFAEFKNCLKITYFSTLHKCVNSTWRGKRGAEERKIHE